MMIRILLFVVMAATVFAAEVQFNWAVVLRPTRLMAGQQQLGQLDVGAVVPVGQVAANGWASVTTELQGKTVTGWAVGSDLWLAGSVRPDGEWVFLKGLDFATQANLRDAATYVAVAAQMSQHPVHVQSKQILDAIGGVLKARQERLPRITDKLNQAATLEKDGAFRMQAKRISGKGPGDNEGAEKMGLARNIRADAATEQRQLDNDFYNAMNDVGTYVDNLGAAGAWDAAIALETLRARFLAQVSAELLKRSGAGGSRMLSTDTQAKQPVGVVAQKVAFANGCLQDFYRAERAHQLSAALAATDKGLEQFPHHRLLQKVRAELLPQIEKVRELMKQVVVARQAGELAKAEELRQQAQKLAADADDLTPPPPPLPGATTTPPAPQ